MNLVHRVTAAEFRQAQKDLTAVLRLPMPPSTNNLFRNVKNKGRVRTDAYKAWQDEAGWALKMQRPAQIDGFVSVAISVERKNHRSDIDNRAKAVLDLLVEHGVIEDDEWVEELTLRWSDEITGATVVVKQLEIATRKARKG